MNPVDDYQALIDKVDNLKKQEKMDLSSDEDLSVALMNLISIEEHLFFTGAKTGKPEYYDLLNEVRGMRKDLLKKIITEYEGEVWCISKHLLGASMRLMEVGTKSLSMGRKDEAKDLFEKGYSLYSLFWGLNLKRPILTNGSNKTDHLSVDGRNSGKSGFLRKFGELVRKALDCCIE